MYLWSLCNKCCAPPSSMLNVKVFVIGGLQKSLKQGSVNLKICRLVVVFILALSFCVLFCPFGYNRSCWDKPWGAGRSGTEQGTHCSSLGWWSCCVIQLSISLSFYCSPFQSLPHSHILWINEIWPQIISDFNWFISQHVETIVFLSTIYSCLFTYVSRSAEYQYINIKLIYPSEHLGWEQSCDKD